MTDIAIGIIITFLFVCMAILFCAILIKVYVAKIKKYNQALFDKQLEQQQAVSQAILETQDATLNNLSQELHDDAGQRISYLNFQLESLKLKDQLQTADLDQLTTTVTDIATGIRDMSHSLTTSSLKDLPLLEVMNRELQRVDKLGLVTCTLIAPEASSFKFGFAEKVIHYRIFQEILNNMMKHSQARAFTVEVTQVQNPHFVYTDNGAGFKPTETKRSNGLRNIESRAQLINYSFDMQSSPNNGTTITLIKS